MLYDKRFGHSAAAQGEAKQPAFGIIPTEMKAEWQPQPVRIQKRQSLDEAPDKRVDEGHCAEMLVTQMRCGESNCRQH